jgi:hypothetical protein
MIPIPQNINTLYNANLIQKAVPDKYHPHYRKWLQYYLRESGRRPSKSKFPLIYERILLFEEYPVSPNECKSRPLYDCQVFILDSFSA